MSKITLEDYFKIATDPDREADLQQYSTIERGAGGVDFQLLPNPALVEVPEDNKKGFSLIELANGAERDRRARRYLRDRIFKPNAPVLVAEGDSWFHFPVLLKDVIRQLGSDYVVASVGAAGDTAENMLAGDEVKFGTEYLRELSVRKNFVTAFLFSGAGNDFIGEDSVTKKPSLEMVLNDYNGDPNDVQGNINISEVERRAAILERHYRIMVGRIRQIPELGAMPIIIHGYANAFPYPWGPNDPRNPVYADRDQWLGRAFRSRKFGDDTQELRGNIIAFLVERLYEMMFSVAGNSARTRIWVVDCRPVLGALDDWADEIHPTDEGFAKVAALFRNTLSGALNVS
ncbi:MAG: hypothetical protein AAFP80_02735 [Pseudomonadota bacterium]